MTTWPTNLPSPKIELDYEVQPAVASNRMETGRLQPRKRFTQRRRAYDVSFVMDMNQLSIFEAFVRFGINEGASEFPLQLPSSVNQVVESQVGIMLDGEYSIKTLAADIQWEVSFTFITEMNETIDEATFVLTNYIEDLEGFSLSVDNLEAAIQAFENEYPWELS